MTPAQFYTSQFYTWEYRGRGWHVAPYPIYLEPPFIPYYRHGYPKNVVDDGKRHTILSRVVEKLKGEPTPQLQTQTCLDYDSLDPYAYEEAINLRALQIKLPKERRIPSERMNALLAMLASIDSPLSFEIIGTHAEIVVQCVCAEHYADLVETYIQAFFPTATVLSIDTYLDHILRDDLSTAVVDFGLRHEFIRSINTPKNFSIDPLIGVVGIMERLSADEHAGIQVLFQPTVNQWSESMLRSVTMYDGSSFFLDEPDAPKIAGEKVRSPLYGVTIRAFAQATELSLAFDILEHLSTALVHGTKGTYNELLPLSDEAYDFETRAVDIITRESHRLGMLLNRDELMGIVHFPSETIASQKLFAATRKTKEVPAIAQHKPFVLGENRHNGITREVTVGIEERVRHMHIVGATGTGKSTLIANLLLQDIKEGNGVVLFDPHGDLVDDVIVRIPRERIDDVVLIDPSDSGYPIGINILEAHSDREKDVLSSDLVAIFRKYTTSWGDQMNTVVANAILAILESTTGGSLHDLRRFLIEKEFRNTVLKSVTDPAVQYYWQKEYPLIKTTSIGPILTRLNTFLRPKAIRNMLVQKKGLDFTALLNTNKIILLKLSQGLIGNENSFLFGSLILSKLHQAILQRQEQSTRNSIFIYLDEFQNFMTPSIKEMISGIRKYNVGLTLSHQDLQQLQRDDADLFHSVLGNCATRIAFRVGESDAKRLEDGLSSFDYHDLQNLGKGQAIVRIEQPQYDCSLDTIALAHTDPVEAEGTKHAIIEHCRKAYAQPREAIEASLLESYDLEERTHLETRDVVPKDTPQPTSTKKQASTIQPVHIKAPEPIEQTTEKATSTHRYLQSLIKNMAEANGYTATLEMPLPDGSGHVDVVLGKEGKRMAVEISNTTDASWEMHNIEKCIHAGYTNIVSLSGDIKHLEKIKKKCHAGIADFETFPVLFFTPDALFAFLQQSKTEDSTDTKHMKGYRVEVSYDAIPQDEMDRKRASVAQVILNTLRKKRKE